MDRFHAITIICMSLVSSTSTYLTVAPRPSTVSPTAYGFRTREDIITNFTREDLEVILCDEMDYTYCSINNIPSWRQYTGENHDFARSKQLEEMGVKAIKSRKKRSFGSSWSYRRKKSNAVPANTGRAFICPQQIDQSAVFGLSHRPEDLPVGPVLRELIEAATLVINFLRELVFNTDPPFIFDDPILDESEPACYFDLRKVVTYFQQGTRSRCHILPNVQPDIYFKDCPIGDSPYGCSSHSGTGGSQNKRSPWDPWASDDDFWGDSGTPFGSYGSNNNGNRGYQHRQVKIVSQCLAHFERVSVWAYCPRNIVGRRITRDTILVPKSCSPYNVVCEEILH